MEVVGIVDIFHFSWVNFTLKVPEVFLAEIQLIIGGKLFDRSLHGTLCKITVDGLGSCLCKALSVEVLTGNLRDKASVSWDVLRLEVIGWSSNPGFSFE